jgi:uncharacterized membrane protein
VHLVELITFVQNTQNAIVKKYVFTALLHVSMFIQYLQGVFFVMNAKVTKLKTTFIQVFVTNEIMD